MAFVAADLFGGGIGMSTVALVIVTLAAIGAVVAAIHGLVPVWLVRLRRGVQRDRLTI
jgi:hypothetical protein